MSPGVMHLLIEEVHQLLSGTHGWHHLYNTCLHALESGFADLAQCCAGSACPALRKQLILNMAEPM